MRVAKIDLNPFGQALHMPFYSSHVRAGFAEPADDHVEALTDLNEHLIKHPGSTFFVRAGGKSMINAGIQDGGLMVVDSSITPKHDDIVIASIDGQLTCKFLDIELNALRSANPHYPPIMIAEGNQVQILGVVTNVINKLCNHS